MENVDISLNSSYDSVPTPTHTSLPESYTDLDLPSSLAPEMGPPYKGATFIIRDIQRRFVITLTDGKLCLLPGHDLDLFSFCSDGRGNHWRCVENKDRWLGFKNVVSGTFIGHDNNQNNWRFMAKVEAHNQWGFFCLRHHPSGGYEMLVKHWHGFRAMKVGGSDSRELIVAEEGHGGTIWEFVEVDSQD